MCSGSNQSSGGTLPATDEQAGGGPGGLKVILGYDFWQKQFGGDKNVLGRTIELDRRQYNVIGVMPAGFQFPIQTDPIDLYVTIAEDAANPDGSKPQTEQRGSHSLRGDRASEARRLRRAGAELISRPSPRTWTKQLSRYRTRISASLVKPLREDLIGDVRTALYVLFGAVVCVLLIANANVANLLLARASVRGKEMALRAAMGASRARIVRQLLTESLLLSGFGGVFGLLFAQWGTDGADQGRSGKYSAHQRDSVGCAPSSASPLLVSLATGVIFGLVPAWQASHVDLNTSLKSGTRTGGGGERKGRVRNALVMAEVALALVLLICAGLLIQSFARLGRVQTGLRTERLLTARVQSAEIRLSEERKHHRFLRAVPAADSRASRRGIGQHDRSAAAQRQQHDDDFRHRGTSACRKVSAPPRRSASSGLIISRPMGIAVRQGRVFDETDRFDSAPVVIVNERFANKYFPGPKRPRETDHAGFQRG